jgi:cold shock CspA family protein
MSERLTGEIVYYASVKQFGFIKPDGTESADVFFHMEQYDGKVDPRVGDRVEFAAEPNLRREGRLRAKAVVPIQNSQTVPAPGHV